MLLLKNVKMLKKTPLLLMKFANECCFYFLCDKYADNQLSKKIPK